MAVVVAVPMTTGLVSAVVAGALLVSAVLVGLGRRGARVVGAGVVVIRSGGHACEGIDPPSVLWRREVGQPAASETLLAQR